MDRTQDTDALRLRLTDLETALREPGGISILEERELLAIRRALRSDPLSVPRSVSRSAATTA